MIDHFVSINVIQDQAQLGAVMKCLSKDRESDAADVEGFQRLVVTARSVAVARPANLVKFADKETGKDESKSIFITS